MNALWRCSLLVGICCISCISAEVASTFACPTSKFRCTTLEKCIPKTWKCDGDDDCGDGSDEKQCPPKACRAQLEFKCRTEQKCIPKRWKCDSENDCSDGSDEENCPKATCRPNFFQCKNARCIPVRWKCDKQDDCGDRSDEFRCPGATTVTCSGDQFKCTDGVCVSNNWVCDGENDCADGSDEKNCNATGTAVPTTCRSTEYRCQNNHCIPSTWRCDGNDDCADKSDEAGCPTVRNRPTCGSAFWQCWNGDCINKRWRCDGENDCIDGSDENCTVAICPTGQYACRNRHQCIPTNLRCNGQVDCMDGTDEVHCGTTKTNCTINDFNCTVSGECVGLDKVCDGRRDCLRGEDEAFNCNINECMDNNGHCSHNCTDLRLGYKCSCAKGFQLDADGRTCQDLDECKVFGTCHQICENKKGGFKCFCAPGYILEPDHKTCKAAGDPEWVYFSNRVDIRKISSDGRDYRVVIGGLRGVVSLDFHIKKRQIFWTDILTDQIQSANITHKYSEDTVVVHRNVHTPDGIAVDWINDKLYWTDTGYKTIEVSELDGSNNLDLLNVGLAEPRAICLDPLDGFLYWTDWGNTAAIERVSMDGDNTTRQVLVDKNIYWPNGLTLDLIQRKLYWIDAKLQRVEAVNLDGTKRRVIKGSGFVHPFALDNFEDQLYWTDWKSDKLRSVSKFNSSIVRTIKDGGLFAPMGIKIYHDSKQKEDGNRCLFHGCSHICLLANHEGRPSTGCACPRSMKLNGKVCTGVHRPRATSPKPTLPKPVATTSQPTTQSTSQIITTEKLTTVKVVPPTKKATKKPTPNPPTTEKPPPTTEKKLPITEKKPPMTEKKPPVTERKQPVTEKKQPKQPMTEKKPHKEKSAQTTVITPVVDVAKQQGNKVKPHKSTSISPGTTAAIILSILVGVILMFALLMYIKRRKLGKGNVMYYKDMSMTPLEDDFDMDNVEMDEKEKIIHVHEYVVS